MTGDQTQNRVEPSNNEFLHFLLFTFFPLNLREQWDISTYLLRHDARFSYLVWTEKKNKKKKPKNN